MAYDEGDDAKIRRNLMVYSGLIVLLAWLHVPVIDLVGAAFKIPSVARVSPLRVWIACAVILIYLTHRYTRCEEFKRSVLQLQNDLFHKKIQEIDDFLEYQAKAYALDISKKSKYIDPIPDERVITLEQLAQNLKVKVSDAAVRLIYIGAVKEGRDSWRGEVSFRYLLVEGKNTNELSKLSSRYKIHGFRKLQIAIWAVLYPLITSRQTTQLIVPCTIAFCAYGVVAYRLFYAI